jgi:hypothetical protein
VHHGGGTVDRGDVHGPGALDVRRDGQSRVHDDRAAVRDVLVPGDGAAGDGDARGTQPGAQLLVQVAGDRADDRRVEARGGAGQLGQSEGGKALHDDAEGQA